jgi:hypothetical protein
MAKTYKRLGATTVVANTDTGLYTVPASTETVVSEITICNIGSTQRTYRVAIVDGAIGDVANEDYKVYDADIGANESLLLNPGWSMEAAATILVRASHAEVVFSCSGIELT